jgi:phosphatidylserine/phosphatidylglycerophosphate/cardiolipin synthase-like enzyme
MFSFRIITRATALVVFFPVVTCLAAKGQDGPLQCGDKIQAVALNSATVSVDIAMYSFTDRSLAEELVRLSRHGVRVRVYRDWREYEQERQRDFQQCGSDRQTSSHRVRKIDFSIQGSASFALYYFF